jgi:transcriptional regulator with XRE-family HTH domain
MTFANYLRDLRIRRGISQLALAKKLKVDPSLVSHLEKGRSPSADFVTTVAEKLLLTLKERETLQFICDSEHIPVGIRQGGGRRALNPVDEEIPAQQGFRKVFVVAERPIELTRIDDENPFLMEMVKAFSSKRRSTTPPCHYTYFSLRTSRSRFGTFFTFLLKRTGLSKRALPQHFDLIFCPGDFCLLSFAIYFKPFDQAHAEEYPLVGRILLRDGEQLESFRVAQMGELDAERAHRRLSEISEALTVHDIKGFEKCDIIKILV